MTVQAFDLKYRPQKFAKVLGNKAVVQLLLSCSKKRTLGSRSLMFAGPKGCGKTSLAKISAMAIVCDDLKDGEPCNECDSCQGVITDTLESFDEFDAATQGTVERIRGIIADLDYGNISGKPTLYILDEAHRLTKQAQDALLKSTEDRRLQVVICTTEAHKIQETIRSRMTEYSIMAPSLQELETLLAFVCTNESIQASPEALKLIIQAQACCPRTCLTSLQLLSNLGDITADSVRNHFRFGQMEKLVRSLEQLSTDPRAALASIGELLDTEGPTWIQENTVRIVTSAVRMSVGAKPTIPVPPTFYSTRGPVWLQVAKQMSMLDRPGPADVEAILLEAIPNLPSGAPVSFPPNWEERLSKPESPTTTPVAAPAAPVASPAPPVVQIAPPPTPQPQPSPAPAKLPAKVESPKPAKSIEIDGVKFDAAETLTSLDKKIEHGTRGAPQPVDSLKSQGVEYDKAREPMSEKEFARGFTQRVRKEN